MAEVIEKPITVPTDPVLRLSVEQYHSMIQSGILTEDDSVELLEGWLILKMPKNPAHSAVTRLIRQALGKAIPDGWYVDTQEPVTTIDSEPEPDVFIMRGDIRSYLERHPGPEDLALVVEVAGATLQRDRALKKRIYANAGIPVYWIVNLANYQIEVYTHPTGPKEQPDYLDQKIYGLRDEIPLMLDEHQVTLKAQNLFP